MDSSLLVVFGAFAIGMLIFFAVGSKNKKNTPQRTAIKKTTEKKQKHKIFIPLTTSQVMSMYFKEYDEKTGIMKIDENRYSVCYEYTDVSFAKANEEQQTAIMMKYIDYLNSLTTNINVQVTHCGVPVSTDTYKEDYVFSITDNMPENERKLASEFNDGIESNLGNKKTTFCETRLIVITLYAENLDSAKDLFYDYQLQIEEFFSTFPSTIRKWSIEERLQLLYNTFNLTPFVLEYPDKSIFQVFEETNKKIEETNKGLPDEEQLSLLSLYDFLAPKSIDPREDDFINIEGKKFIKVMYVKKFPTSITPLFYNRLTTMEANLIVTENITPTDPQKTIKKLEKKISGLQTEEYEKVKRAVKNGIPYEYCKDEKLAEKLENQRGLRKALVKKKQKLFKKNILVCIIANDIDEMQRVEKQVKTLAGEYLVEMGSVKWQQFEALQSLLPFGHNTLQFKRSLHSEATAESIPFNSKSITHKKALYYGIDLVSKKMLCCDRKLLINGNACVLATSGAGKSFFEKTNIEQIYLRYPEDEIFIIDPQGEYAPVIEALGGQIVEISTTANTYINPFDLELQYVDEDNDPVKTKIEYILAFMESIVGNLTGEQESIIDRASRRIYEEYDINPNENNKPSFPVFYKELQTYNEVEAKNLVLILERYVQGGMDIFSKDTNIEIHNRVICFDLHNLTASMQTTGYLVVLENIMNRVVRNKSLGRNTWLDVDEGHILLANTYSADYIAKIYKIGRKYGVLVTFITQNIADVLKSEQGCKILSNTEFAVILKQKPLDLSAICKIFNISQEQAKYCSIASKSGQGLIIYGEDIVPFRNLVSKDSYIYELNNTDGMQVAR